MAFPGQKQEAFFEGHRQAFRIFGGVPHGIAYDNLKAAVLSVRGPAHGQGQPVVQKELADFDFSVVTSPNKHRALDLAQGGYNGAREPLLVGATLVSARPKLRSDSAYPLDAGA